MSELCDRFGGMRYEAWAAITPEIGSPPDGVVKLRIRPDSRYGYGVISTLGNALDFLKKRQGTEAVSALLCFYEPLFTSRRPVSDESGGKLPSVGPVLSPVTCTRILEGWKSIDLAKARQALEECPVFFDPEQRPHKWFNSAAHLLEYLSGYAAFLDEAVARDSFYFSYDGICL